MIDWDDFAPVAAIGLMAVIAIPLIVVALPFYFIGRLVGWVIEKRAPTPLTEGAAA